MLEGVLIDKLITQDRVTALDVLWPPCLKTDIRGAKCLWEKSI